MLKPLKTDDLSATLDSVRNQVNARRHSNERQVISSGLLGQQRTEEHPAYFSETTFRIFLLSVGNLHNPMTSYRASQSVHELWKRIDWDKTVSALKIGVRNWWLIDERVPNQKFLILSLTDTVPNPVLSRQITDDLRSLLLDKVDPYSLNIGCDNNGVSYEALWSTAQQLRTVLERTVRIGSSETYFLNDSSPAPGITQLMSGSLAQQINASVGRPELLEKIVNKMFDAWEQGGLSQRQVERELIDFIRLIRKETVTSQGMGLVDAEAVLMQRISEAVHLKDVKDAVWPIVLEMSGQSAKEDSASLLADHIEKYLQEHYADDISLEELARKFNFTSAYLTKVFKKFKNETPLKFVIQLRLEEAKRLMVEHPDLELKVIAGMIGYPDQHYFSKVFKQMTGTTPSDYRSSQQE